MTGHVGLVIWASPMAPSRLAAELLPVGSGSGSIELAITGVAGHLGNAHFLIVNANSVDTTTLSRAIKAFHAAKGNPRLCLAGDRGTLTRMDATGLDNDHVGLMLDDVSADTACSDLIWDRIEAVRFNAEFVARAARDVRTACALESMLGLAREIGLRTLGFDAVPKGASLSGRCSFDYLPIPADSATHTPLRGPLPHRTRTSAAETLHR